MDFIQREQKLRFNCDFCGKNIAITEGQFALWNQGEVIHCEVCKEKFENNVNQVARVR